MSVEHAWKGHELYSKAQDWLSVEIQFISWNVFWAAVTFCSLSYPPPNWFSGFSQWKEHRNQGQKAEYVDNSSGSCWTRLHHTTLLTALLSPCVQTLQMGLLCLALLGLSAALVCPDGGMCEDKNTCCKNTVGGYGCCPLPHVSYPVSRSGDLFAIWMGTEHKHTVILSWFSRLQQWRMSSFTKVNELFTFYHSVGHVKLSN